MDLINENLEELEGKPVKDWEPGNPIVPGGQTIYRIRVQWEDKVSWLEKFAQFLDTPGASDSTGFVVGMWSDASMTATMVREVEAIVNAHDRLPRLTTLFLGDVVSEECEISWLQMADISPIFLAYPNLEHFYVRGGDRLDLGVAAKHANLKSLTIQTGGLSVRVPRQIQVAEFPNLERLTIWFGDSSYGADTTVADLAPLLSGALFPKLKYLGLCNAEFTDDIAEAIAQSPLLTRIDVLDLSLGTLSDRGARALISSPAIAKLKKLDVHHHFCSAPVVNHIKSLALEVDVSDQQDEEDADGRYVAISE